MATQPEENLQRQSHIYCQCCLSSTWGLYKDVTTEYFNMGTKEVYEKMLFNVLHVNLLTVDTERKICEVCISKLREATQFKKLVLESQLTLLQKINADGKNDFENVKVKLEDNDSSCEEDFDDELDDNRIKMETEVTEIKDTPAILDNTVEDNIASTSTEIYPGGIATKIDKLPSKMDKWINEKHLKLNTVKIIKNSNICPFKWHKNKYQCFCCTNTYSEFMTLRDHMADHTWIDVKCIITRYNTLLYHKVEISGLKCKICSKTQENLNHLRDHLIKHHYLLFKKESDLLIPFKLENGYQCALCPESFSNFHKLNIHINIHYQNFICETCGAGFANQGNLRAHSLRHKDKPNVCKECHIDFANAYQKDQHDCQVHQKTAKRVCPYCGERFSNHYSRIVHLINTHGEKKTEFKCNSCDKVFLFKFQLNRHVRKVHMREKTHECDVCCYKFFNKSDLKNHMVTHTGVKDHICSICGKSYSRKATLTWHLRSHSNKESTNLII